jgi:hypothetical protein
LNWSICFICQEATSESLKCPQNALGHDPNNLAAYDSFLKNIERLRQTDCPVPFEFELTSETLKENNASWHKSCSLKYSNTKVDQIIARKKKNEKPEQRQPRKRKALSIEDCIFCEKGTEDGPLHECSTFQIDQSIRTIATELEDVQLLARLSGGDVIAIEAKYHKHCLTHLQNRYRSYKRKLAAEKNTDVTVNESRVFVELIAHITTSVETGEYMFQLKDLFNLYVERLKSFDIHKDVNKTRLKQQILDHFKQDLQEQHIGKNVVLVFKEGMEKILKNALKERDFSEEVRVLAKAATIVRQDMFDHKGFQFSGTFEASCQEDSVPCTLKSLISMILHGTRIKDQESKEPQAVLTISQLCHFHVKKTPSKAGGHTRHAFDREPPLPLYLGLNIHAVSRSKKIIQTLNDIGLSISYDRVMQLEDQITSSVCERFEKDDVVVPALLKKNCFTVAALDNIDHNPSSTTSIGSFHGTGISLFQFLNEQAEVRPPICLPPEGQGKKLLNSYTLVPELALQTSSVKVLPSEEKTVQRSIQPEIGQEYQWLKQSQQLLSNDLETGVKLSWSAYHASTQAFSEKESDLHALLPLFPEKAATPAMIKHGMNVIKDATQFLNEGQIPVMTVDQPLFALAKYIQWKSPQTHGEDKYVVMLGGLHTEMALWSTVGDILDGSGWTTVLAEADVVSSGIAQSLLKASHVMRTRYAHQVTLLSLYNLQLQAYNLSQTEKTFEEWKNFLKDKSPTFFYWDLIMHLEARILVFVRAHRIKDFDLYVESLEDLAPLFFALDHTNYARWLPVHIRDMRSIPHSVKESFSLGHWVISKTKNRYSSMPIDQAHEQENKIVKGCGGAVGLMDNHAALHRFMVSGPELARLVKELEKTFLREVDDEDENFHHQEGLSDQKLFQKKVCRLTYVICNFGNPFLDEFPDMVRLDSRNIVDEVVSMAIRQLEHLGKQQYESYKKDVLTNQSEPIQKTIKKNALPLLSTPLKKVRTKEGEKIETLKTNAELMGKLLISLQSRDGNLPEFFSHEVQSFPPSLSDFGKIHLPPNKSQILSEVIPKDEFDPPVQFDCTILDGAAIVHMLKTGSAKTFEEYSETVFIPHLKGYLASTDRLDIIWDRYLANSLKATTREKRGRARGVRRKVAATTKLPGNWPDFLRDDNNKAELFDYLSNKVCAHSFPEGKLVVITAGENVLSNHQEFSMQSCSHEEADTRIVVHLMNALETGSKIFSIRTVDTDVLIILIGKFHDIQAQIPFQDIWVMFGSGKNLVYHSIRNICNHLGVSKSKALPFFHAFTGSDTTSAFRGKGKKTAWNTWQAFSAVTEIFMDFSTNPFKQINKDSPELNVLQRFVVNMYTKSSPLLTVNEARMDIFCKKNQSMENLPPTEDALIQHAKRCIFQAGIWYLSTVSEPDIPSASSFGWKENDSVWKPEWITIPEVSQSCRELVKCSCTGDCKSRRCSCGSANLPCTQLCKCNCTV